eukprot:gnl/MRDRNA2_/MRDRNA2_82505_c0_seq3.p1 gnl/MRDRNA2_/MRDRNA2_82505_c0~~gnl/MRDRNA2_/MRDRNA2_82505_c0_seq3.p1  ORF type:complete len:183 (+),score=8.88 gnl/MRDRNA2_/MRDRNA2_82505_c0_seq3:88-636(+)
MKFLGLLQSRRKSKRMLPHDCCHVFTSNLSVARGGHRSRRGLFGLTGLPGPTGIRQLFWFRRIVGLLTPGVLDAAKFDGLAASGCRTQVSPDSCSESMDGKAQDVGVLEALPQCGDIVFLGSGMGAGHRGRDAIVTKVHSSHCTAVLLDSVIVSGSMAMRSVGQACKMSGHSVHHGAWEIVL